MARILLVDDDDFFRDMLRTTLEGMEHEVTVAKNGREALRLHEPGAFDLVLTDLIMPEVEGIETIIELRGREPALRVVAMSGGGRSFAEDYLHIARKFGAEQVLAKPFTIEELTRALTDALA